MSTTAAQNQIDTRKVRGRRELHFANFAELQADAERLAASPNLQTLGNWTLGQAFGHLAYGMNMAIDGNNPIKPPWILKLLAPLFKKQVLKKMSPGFRLPGAAEEKLVPQPSISTADGLVALKTAINRMQTESRRQPRNFLGKLTREEWDRLQLSHAELHLSFFVP